MRRAIDLEPIAYPETDDMGEAELHRLITELLRVQLQGFLGRAFRVGANQFFYLEKGKPTERCAPDVYVLRGVGKPLVRSWRAWELASPPVFALEIVSSDSLKDYVEAPVAQARLGTKELVVFDPEGRGRRERNVWRVHRRRREGFYLVSTSDGDRVRSEALGCWLRVVGHRDARRIRIATGRGGEHLVPTTEEERDGMKIERDAALDRERRVRNERDALRAELARLKRRR